jgi:hypothetical protein
MDIFVFLVLPLMTFVFGFLPISLALMGYGKADLVTALKFAVVPGVVGLILTWFYYNLSNTALLTTVVGVLTGSVSMDTLVSIGTAVYPVEVVAIVLGLASMAFLMVGITGWTFKPEAASVTAHIVNFVGIMLIILGAFVGYWYMFLPFYALYIAAAMVFLLGIACLLAGFSVLGKVKGGAGILGIVVINTILAFVLLFMTTM